MQSPASFIDHTLLKPDTTTRQIHVLCEEAVENGFAAVCIPPRFVALAADLLYGSEISVATVVGFPLGYTAPEIKALETAEALRAGAQEIDMVIQIGAALEGDIDLVQKDLRKVVEAASGIPVKVILECALLPDRLKEDLTHLAVESGASFVKTSTGFAGGATVSDVKLLARAAAGRVGVKAAGGIRTLAACREMLAAGATRIGTSSGVEIMAEWQRELGA